MVNGNQRNPKAMTTYNPADELAPPAVTPMAAVPLPPDASLEQKLRHQLRLRFLGLRHTYASLARELNPADPVSPQAVSQILDHRSEHTLTVRTLQEYARALGMELTIALTPTEGSDASPAD